MKKVLSVLLPLSLAALQTGCSYSSALINKNKINATNNHILNISISGGTITPAKTTTAQSYQPINFSINQGKCVTTLIQLNTKDSQALQTCYTGNVLFLDTKGIPHNQSAIRFYYTPLWNQGFAYNNITTNGRAHLNNVTVTVKSN